MTHIKNRKRKNYIKNLVSKLDNKSTDYVYYKLERLFDKRYGKVFKPKKQLLNKTRYKNNKLKNNKKYQV